MPGGEGPWPFRQVLASGRAVEVDGLPDKIGLLPGGPWPEPVQQALVLPHLFERFHRVQGALSRSHEGSGIGLALVRELVKLHGGSVAVASTVGQGSAFTVSLPLGSSHLPKDRLAAPRALASTATGGRAFVEEALRWLPDGKTSPSTPGDAAALRILLADDNADMREYVKRLLGGRYEVETVGNDWPRWPPRASGRRTWCSRTS